ncbi:hypothetical protein BJ508DRAFT_311290 [Ascobolus immersus RN42]|uniref:Uncharacterized protein n=1 Tax=Ascobolus immersus RN42 TaxID=1160509 RepID=A0A3N4HWF5_ASCIM|nr:hypothetical protein BJ508DRAFT_311290 [Ascobolus immersus RN42]
MTTHFPAITGTRIENRHIWETIGKRMEETFLKENKVDTNSAWLAVKWDPEAMVAPDVKCRAYMEYWNRLVGMEKIKAELFLSNRPDEYHDPSLLARLLLCPLEMSHGAALTEKARKELEILASSKHLWDLKLKYDKPEGYKDWVAQEFDVRCFAYMGQITIGLAMKEGDRYEKKFQEALAGLIGALIPTEAPGEFNVLYRKSHDGYYVQKLEPEKFSSFKFILNINNNNFRMLQAYTGVPWHIFGRFFVAYTNLYILQSYWKERSHMFGDCTSSEKW